ncbi:MULTISPECIES: T9SS-dependent M36 family metallopeptidase [Bizionia]|uniref:T9SS type A sorting domain-containing protein n=1 Tax=Bizionia algoritergicola TaxID=291187 RepID=A0A5D0R3K2_9FLAO|nr:MULTISPECIES: T9SS-dependent M36 family metallopeptidase [Bizionia]OBX23694.1 peptidase [Bizionia sp. APA-3]TYB75416.1 T9SS type A sorting domain-containing protein [Bizionia algoritergicola]
MKNNYAKKLLFLAVLVFANVVYAQSNLMESNYASVIQNYLNQNKEKYGLSVSDISDLTVDNEFLSKNSKITHVYVNQRYQGIPIFNALSSVAIKGNAVFYYANRFTGNVNQRINTTSPQLTAKQAIQNVATQLNLGSVQNLDLIEKNNNTYVYSNGAISQATIPVKLVYFQNEAGNLTLSWDLSIHTLDGANWYSVRVDAVSGEINNQNDWILTCNFGDLDHINHGHVANTLKQVESNFTLFKEVSYLADGSQYNVYAFPVSAPNDGDRMLVTEPADLVASPYGWHDINGTAGADFTIARGNNVWAMEDRDGNDGFGYSPSGSSTLNFDFPLDFNQQPEGYQDASITNLFYVNNMMHDIWYKYGFDEASGNFQANNYGNGGVANDYVRADAQDGNGLNGSINNASFGTPPDGSNPSMRMFLWSAPGGGVQNLVTVNNSSAIGSYVAANPATEAPNNILGIGPTPVTADLQLVTDGTAAPTLGCNPVASVAGKIAVIRRGTCPFVDKIQNAQDAGAVAVIVLNHNNPDNDPAYVPYVTMAGEANPLFTIPSVFMNFADGEILLAAMQTETVNVTLQGPSPFMLDGSLDNGIVAHEYGHGISNRLTGGAFQTTCLTNATQMGEGWSDWFAMMLTIKPGDAGDDARAAVTYSLGQPNDGPGLPDRPYRYSTDMSENPFTYAITNNTNLSAPHGIGSVWATMLWDLSWAYIEKYSFDADLFNGVGGNNKVMQLVIDGLKLQPCSPDFIDGRDALLAADMATTGGEDQCMIWEVFSNRGLGLNASGGSKFSRTDQVEDFSMPLDTDPSLQNCTSLSVDEFKQSDYKVYPNPTNNNLFIKTNKSYGQVIMTITDMNGRQVYNKEVDLFGTVEINMNTLQSGIYILNMKGQNIDANHKIIKN